MSLPSVVLLSCTTVLSRSSLNIIDRFVFSKSRFGFLRLYFFTNALPLLLALCLLPFFKTTTPFWSYFLTWPCFFWALATHLVGISFSYAFRESEVRQVIIKSKMPELFFACAAFIPFFSNSSPLFSVDLKTYATLITTSIGLVFLSLGNRSKILSLFDRTGLCIIGSLLIQMVCSSIVSISAKTVSEAIPLSVAMLLWRCCLMVPLLFRKETPTPDKKQQPSNILGILFLRSILALITQLTFTWCVLEGSPLLVWPIFNTTPLVASLASQAILQEKPHWSEILALLCFFSGSTYAVFL